MIGLVYTNFVSFVFPRETRNVPLVGIMKICESKQEIQTNVINIVANSHTQVSPHTAQDVFF